MACHTVALQGDSVAIDSLAVGIQYLQGDACGLGFRAVGEFCGNADVAIVAGGNTKRMTVEINILGCGDEADVAIQSTTSVPARVAGHAGISDYLNQIILAVFKVGGNVNVEAHIAIVCATDALTVEQNVGCVHDAFEVE